MNVVVDNERLRISYERGEGDVLVIAFAGVGLALGGIQTEEFRNSVKQLHQQGQCSVAYVLDKRRSWYNDGVGSEIADALNLTARQVEASKVVTLGNSMGGTGALIFAGILANCSQAIAFCPQSSVNPDVAPFETRWGEWRKSIEKWDFPDATATLEQGVKYDIFYGEDDPLDLQHARRFSTLDRPNINLHMLSKCGHDVAMCRVPDDCIDPRRLALFAGRAFFRDLIITVEARQAGEFRP